MRIARGTLTFLLLAFATGAMADVTQVNGATSYHCYSFGVGNHTEKDITDIHFSVDETPARPVPAKYMLTPRGWQAEIDANGDLVFKTPGDAATTGTTTAKPVEKPIKPGKSLHGYRFCLPAKTSLKYSISYADHSLVQQPSFGGVPEGGTVIHNSSLTCIKLHLTAPDSPVSDAHFGGGGGNPHFEPVSPPSGWSGDRTEDGSTVNLQTTGNPLAAGQSVDIEFCFPKLPPRLTWKFTDEKHQDIPGASGQITPKK